MVTSAGHDQFTGHDKTNAGHEKKMTSHALLNASCMQVSSNGFRVSYLLIPDAHEELNVLFILLHEFMVIVMPHCQKSDWSSKTGGEILKKFISFFDDQFYF
jgi:hypothetical protein